MAVTESFLNSKIDEALEDNYKATMALISYLRDCQLEVFQIDMVQQIVQRAEEASFSSGYFRAVRRHSVVLEG